MASVLIPGNEKLYSNSLLQEIGDMVKSPPKHNPRLKSSSGSYHIELSSAYIDDFDDLNNLCSYHLYELTSRRGKQICYALGVSDTCTTLLTNFVNIFILTLKFSTEILTKIIAITGHREAEGGLETLFVCFEKSDTPLYGTCVNVCILKLSCTYNLMCNRMVTYGQCDGRIWTNKKGNFSLTRYTNYSLSQDFYKAHYTKYQTDSETYVPHDFLKSVEEIRQEQTSCHKTTYHIENVAHEVPVRYLKLDTLCGFEERLYFVRHEFPNSLCMGMLAFTLEGIKLHTLCHVEEKDIKDIPLSNLKPLTMI